MQKAPEASDEAQQYDLRVIELRLNACIPDTCAHHSGNKNSSKDAQKRPDYHLLSEDTLAALVVTLCLRATKRRVANRSVLRRIGCSAWCSTLGTSRSGILCSVNRSAL